MKRPVTFDGRAYKVRSDRVEIPDLASMPRMEALVWLNRHTYRRGYRKAPSPLVGLGEVLNIQIG